MLLRKKSPTLALGSMLILAGAALAQSQPNASKIMKNFADGWHVDFLITKAIVADLHTRYIQPEGNSPLDPPQKAIHGRPMETIKFGDQTIPVYVGVKTSSTQKTAPLNSDQLLTLGIEAGKPIKQALPNYPRGLKRLRISGTVHVRITIDEKGNVIDSVMISGDSLFKAVSLKAARQWKFEPTFLNGAPIKVLGMLTFTFSHR